MDKEMMATWPRDLETGLPMVPPGEFTTFKEYPGSTQPARIRKLPVLRGWFDAKQFELNLSLPAHVGWGSVQLGASQSLTFRIQLGPNMLYWLANAADQHVWSVIDKWASAGKMVLAAEFDGAPPLIVCRDFDLHHRNFSALRKLTSAPSQTASFLAEASRVIVEGEMKVIATSDIAAYPKLEQVQACIVRTPETQGVTVMVNEGKPGPQGPVADTVEALSRALLESKQTRH